MHLDKAIVGQTTLVERVSRPLALSVKTESRHQLARIEMGVIDHNQAQHLRALESLLRSWKVGESCSLDVTFDCGLPRHHPPWREVAVSKTTGINSDLPDKMSQLKYYQELSHLAQGKLISCSNMLFS